MANNYIFQEFNLNYLAAAKQQTLNGITMKKVHCTYDDGTEEDKLCVEYRYDRVITDDEKLFKDGNSVRMTLFPRYKVKDLDDYNGKQVDNVWFRIGAYTNETTGEVTIGKPKWFAVQIDGEFIDFSNGDLEEFVDHGTKQ